MRQSAKGTMCGGMAVAAHNGQAGQGKALLGAGNMDNALADSVFLDVTGRTAKRLLEMAGDEDEFELPLTQEELAGMVGASRERVNKSINQFIKLGWLAQTEGGYRITNRQQLTIRSR